MNIFNRREIFVTMDLQKFNQILNLLDKKNINYTYKTCNASGVNSGTVQSIGLNRNYMNQYYVYVHKNDFEKASLAIRGIKLF